MGMAPIATASEFAAAVDGQFPKASAGVKAHYVVESDAEANDVYLRLMTDAMFRCPSRRLARMASAGGSKVYLYSYSFEEGMAFHAFELGYVFGGTWCNDFAPCVDSLQASIQKYWTTLAAKGDPNGEDQPAWPVYDTAGDRHMTMKVPPVAGSGLSKDDCDFWDSLPPRESLEGMGLTP